MGMYKKPASNKGRIPSAPGSQTTPGRANAKNTMGTGSASKRAANVMGNGGGMKGCSGVMGRG